MRRDRRGADGRGRGTTVRARVLLIVLAFMAAGLAISDAVSTAVQLRRVDERVEAGIEREIRGVEYLAESRAEEGRPFPDAESLLRSAIETASASEHQALLALVDGSPRFRSHTSAVQLDTPQVLDVIATHARPGQTVTTDIEADGRDVRVAIVSVEVAGSDQQGTFVVAEDVSTLRAEVWSSSLVYAGIGVATLAVGGFAAWAVTGRMLRPLNLLRQASGEISVQQLGRRVPVPETQDDVAALAGNFNNMLERIQAGFGEQQEFMRSVGHELRTPLTIIGGTLETTDVSDPDDVREGHQIATDELERMGMLLDDLSVLASASDPSFVRRSEVSLRDLGSDALARITHLGHRRWELVELDDVIVHLDAQRLLQAVIQLAANAVRYSEDGTAIRLRAQYMAIDGGTVRISIEDEGRGVTAGEREQIFERFVRGSASSGTDGTGLGLAIVRSIAEAHGGRVELRSTPGEGSRFTVVLPGVDGTDEGAGQQTPRERDDEA